MYGVSVEGVGGGDGRGLVVRGKCWGLGKGEKNMGKCEGRYEKPQYTSAHTSPQQLRSKTI